MKVYSLCSGRRAESDIRECVERDHLSRPWHYNTLFRVMEDPATTEILIKALAGGAVRSKLPVARANEVLAKVLLHNLTCIVHAIEEFGIEVDLAPRLTVVKP